jgi:hypothetical protein
VFFVYLLALVGLLCLFVLAGLAIVSALRDPAGPPAAGDPFDEALSAVATIQARAWEAIHQLRALDSERGAVHPPSDQTPNRAR